MPSRHAALSTKFEVALALGVLCAGSLVYVLDRPVESAAFFGAVITGQNVLGFFGPIGNSLPTFTHTFSFVILTSVWLGGARRACLASCAIWLSIDCVFEMGQHPQIAGHIVPFIPPWFEGLPILEYAHAYFASGTFDTWDLISIIAGATAAYLVTALSVVRKLNHE